MKLTDLTRLRSEAGLDGVSIPGFIRNGRFFLSSLAIFEDGLIDCWGMVDIPLFEDKLISGFVRTSIPEGETLCIHPMGELVVASPQWESCEDGLLRCVEDLVTQLNPDRSGLYDMQGCATETVDGARYVKVDRRVAGCWLPSADNSRCAPLKGRRFQAFERVPGGREVVDVVIFENDSVITRGRHGSSRTNFASFKEKAEAGHYDFPVEGDRIGIHGIGTFICAGSASHGYGPGVVAGELEDLRNHLLGRPARHEVCREAFDTFCKSPNAETFETLRQAYEAVPVHLRKYCGGMDAKDIPIRMALYGNGEIAGWNHRQAADLLGLQLPTKDTPKFKD